MEKIYAFHLLNDFSGSPKVLSQLIKAWTSHGKKVHLSTDQIRTGFLADKQGISFHKNQYKYYDSKLMKLVSLIFSQVWTILYFSTKIKKHDIIYVNTILPFGGAIAGWIKGATVVYHIHETSIKPEYFKKFLLFWVKKTAKEVVYVSNFLAQQEPLDVPKRIIWNAIEEDFLSKARASRSDVKTRRNVLMLASLKKYKGVDEYIELAKYCPAMNFQLVLNAEQREIDTYFSAITLPANILIFPAQSDVHPFYQKADFVCNLSRPEEWKETFGLTAIEAMSYGLPVIVPEVGGIAEIVGHESTGFHVNGRHTETIAEILQELMSNEKMYNYIRNNSLEQISSFTESHFINQSLDLLRSHSKM